MQRQLRWRPRGTGAVRLLAALVALGVILFVLRGYYVEYFLGNPRALRGAAAVVVAVLVLIRVGQHYEWTGLGESVRPKRDDQEIWPRKTLWDWLQLFVVPLSLVLIGLAFSIQQDTRQQAIEDQRARQTQEIEEQRRQDEALQAYLDQMSTLMLEENLRTSEENGDARTLARARTLTVIGRLDPNRKTTVMQFLVEAELVQSVEGRGPLIELSGADLSGADKQPLLTGNLRGVLLSDADLSNADLRGADLNGADFHGAVLRGALLSDDDLRGADLSGTDLSGAYLRRADLSGADLSGAYAETEADLIAADLSDANLEDALLSGANLSNTNLSGANLGGSVSGPSGGTDLPTISFGADLSGANLSDANLSDADLTGAMLNGASLGGTAADLSGAVLSGADFGGADLSGVDLRGAEGTTNEELEQQAASLKGATMPDGQRYEDWLKSRGKDGAPQ